MKDSFRARAGSIRRRSMGWMSGAVGMVFLLPIVVGKEGVAGDSSFTSVGIAGGAGSYACITRGCEGQVLSKEDVPFRDAGFSIEHRTPGSLQFGMRGGWYSESSRMDQWRPHAGVNAFYVNPNVAMELRRFGLGFGPLLSEAPLHDLLFSDEDGGDRGIHVMPTGHIRIGSAKTYFSLHLLEGVPLVSGGGFLAAGLGFAPRPGASAWFGLSTPLPYDGLGVLAKAAVPIGRNSSLQLGLRCGVSEGLAEYGLSLGLDYRMISAR